MAEAASGRGGGGAGPTIRWARTPDVRAIRAIVAPMAQSRVLIAKEAVTYYEALQQFRVAELDGRSWAAARCT